MSDKLVTIATFESSATAHSARARLELEGIRAVVTDDVVVETLWHAGSALGGIRLKVMADDAERAHAILCPDADYEAAPSAPWRCGSCQVEVDAGFDVCWSCMGRREDVEDRTAIVLSDESPATTSHSIDRFADTAPPTPSAEKTENPYASSFHPADSQDHPTAVIFDVEETVRRALRCSIIGLVICPVILHVYSTWLLIAAAFAGQEFSSAAAWRFYVAMLINVPAVIIYVTVLLKMY